VKERAAAKISEGGAYGDPNAVSVYLSESQFQRVLQGGALEGEDGVVDLHLDRSSAENLPRLIQLVLKDHVDPEVPPDRPRVLRVRSPLRVGRDFEVTYSGENPNHSRDAFEQSPGTVRPAAARSNVDRVLDKERWRLSNDPYTQAVERGEKPRYGPELPDATRQKAQEVIRQLMVSTRLDVFKGQNYQLEQLRGGEGFWSVRVNHNYRVTFFWGRSKCAQDIQLTDHYRRIK
jgi:plasmid maintenance system killer protein